MNEKTIVLDDLSKFYGEVLGVNRVSLEIPPGITSLVGPNGSGKTTLMNLIAGLLRPSQGSIRIHGLTPQQPEQLFRLVGYCTQFDSFPKGMSGRRFVESFLRLHGHGAAQARKIAAEAIERVGLTEAAGRRVAGYSKGMRQRIKLAQAIAHGPAVLLLDEPLNGLDPMARAETIRLFKGLASDGLHVIVSSHILHEVDLISDTVILMNEGYVVAEGNIRAVRGEIEKHPLQVLVRCDQPSALASKVFAQDSVVEARIHTDGGGVLVSTKDVDGFYRLLNKIVLEENIQLEQVLPADDSVKSVYEYLIGQEGGKA